VSTLTLKADSIYIDSLSIVPQSELIYLDGLLIDNSFYEIDYGKSLLIVKDLSILNKKVKISYRVFPVSFSQSYEHKKIGQIEQYDPVFRNPFLFEYVPATEDVFYLNGLNKSGSISRGVTFGNNQDLAVNSSLNLQLSGKVTSDISILASISDDNIPIQAEGNTQQLQDFDNVFIQLFNEQWKLTAGDFYMNQPKSYFLNYNKKAKGGSFEIALNPNKKHEDRILTPSISAAIAKGKYARNQFIGVEGNQGPYRLKGNDNETFIIILSGTEQVFVDGELLKRGNEFDYVIDYNTSEITFTANFLITKDKRIVVLFEYSDKNYSRTIYNSNTGYESEKLKLNLTIYSEQDLKDQPLQQDLTNEQKLVLGGVGDSLQQAIVPNFNAVEFSENKVLYKMIDTLGYDSVFVYSTDPDSAIYQLGFSQVGANNGNYVQIQSSANGKVYEWITPISGVPQGNYEPVILLISPKKLQITTLGGEYKFSEKSIISWEGALSNYDKNTFSTKDADDNIGYAFKVNSINKISLDNTQEKGWEMLVGGGYEYVDKDFNFLGPFRNIEFQRDWNTSNLMLFSDQHLGQAHIGIEKDKKASLVYQIDVLQNIDEYKGVKNNVVFHYNLNGFSAIGSGSFLYTDGLQNTRFFRNKLKLSQQIGWLVVGVEEEFEQNKFLVNLSDTLKANSYQFLVWKSFLQNADTSINKYTLSYQQRTDNAPLINKLTPTTKAEDVAFGFDWLKNKNHILRTKFTYRKLQIVEPTLSTIEPDENVLSRIEYVGKLLKSVITLNSYYQVGSGLEVKKEFSYAEVQPGQGTHAYLGDLNGNGVNDLNEFEVAAFQDQANFIKIYTPTNDYVRTYTNDFNQGLFLNPEAKWGSETGFKKFISRFANRTNYRVARKVSDKKDYYNPFIAVDDSSLVTLNLGFLNTIYFNRTSTKWSVDYTYQDNQDKSLLTNGKESRKYFTRTLKFRWNLTRILTFNTTLANGVKNNKSQFFTNQNYYLTNYEAEPKLIIQPNVKFRITLLYKYKEKYNEELLGGQELKANKVGGELRYNIASKGSFMLSVNYIENKYKSIINNESLNYEMLEGLKQGANTTWELVFQQNLSKHMQLSLNYNGRKSNDAKIIHIGGVQVRAFF
tara:strand:- start:466 stop:3843 length:3378 start_codon:yes stop_codon:yes gene_type:complete